MQCKKEDTIRRGWYNDDRESNTQTVLQALIPKVVSALGFPVLTVYVIGAEHEICLFNEICW